MRFQAIVCALGLCVALAGAESATAQSRGPPMMAAGAAVHVDLGSRAQALVSKLSGKTDAASVNALKEVRALQAKLGARPSEHDLENIEIAISRIEQSTH